MVGLKVANIDSQRMVIRVERRVMSAIELCWTAALGGHVERCADCGLVRTHTTPAATGTA